MVIRNLVIALLISLIAFISFFQFSEFFIHVQKNLTTILAIVGFIYLIYFAVSFNIYKNHSKWFSFNDYREQIELPYILVFYEITILYNLIYLGIYSVTLIIFGDILCLINRYFCFIFFSGFIYLLIFNLLNLSYNVSEIIDLYFHIQKFKKYQLERIKENQDKENQD